MKLFCPSCPPHHDCCSLIDSSMAAQRTHIPAYGNWDGEDGVPYTEIFAKARKGRTNATTKMVNPNDPEEDPEMLKERETEDQKDSNVVGTMQERRMSEDSLEFKRNLHSHPTKPSAAGSDNSNEKSPMHKHGRVSGRGSSSPMWEGRATRDGIQGTPGRSHLASSSRGDNPDKVVTVPKFGEWDESNPASGEGYTQVFNAVREVRQGIARDGNDAHDSSRSSAARSVNASSSKGCCCCCPWLRT